MCRDGAIPMNGSQSGTRQTNYPEGSQRSIRPEIPGDSVIPDLDTPAVLIFSFLFFVSQSFSIRKLVICV